MQPHFQDFFKTSGKFEKKNEFWKFWREISHQNQIQIYFFAKNPDFDEKS